VVLCSCSAATAISTDQAIISIRLGGFPLNEQDFSRDSIWQKATRTQLSRFSTILLLHFFFWTNRKAMQSVGCKEQVAALDRVRYYFAQTRLELKDLGWTTRVQTKFDQSFDSALKPAINSNRRHLSLSVLFIHFSSLPSPARRIHFFFFILRQN